MKINKIILLLTVLSISFISCENQDIEFPDFEYQTVYFASQYPVRTLQLGNDEFVDLSTDNDHKINIKATMGGAYKNTKDRIIDFEVSNSLCDNLYFIENGREVRPMPQNYYVLSSNQIIIPSGSEYGSLEVQLTDAFFADPMSLSNNYVIPLIMTKVQNADSILQGQPTSEDPSFNPDRCITSDWILQPRDFVLYAVKYVNPWHGNYVRRGIDNIILDDGTVTKIVRHKEYVEYDEEVKISTNSLKQAKLPLTIKDKTGNDVIYNLILNFDDYTKEDKIVACSITNDSDKFDIIGTGKFETKGEKNSLGGYDRDALYLEYTVNFKDLNWKYEVKDTLVVRDRGVSPEYFTVERR